MFNYSVVQIHHNTLYLNWHCRRTLYQVITNLNETIVPITNTLSYNYTVKTVVLKLSFLTVHLWWTLSSWIALLPGLKV